MIILWLRYVSVAKPTWLSLQDFEELSGFPTTSHGRYSLRFLPAASILPNLYCGIRSLPMSISLPGLGLTIAANWGQSELSARFLQKLHSDPT
jgi:hypothetical protein